MVTGASRGLGRTIAARLAVAGWDVFAAMRDPGDCKGLDELVERDGINVKAVRTIQLDVLDRQSIGPAMSELLEETQGRLDAVVACAGIIVIGPFEEVPYEATRRVMDTNFFGATEIIRAALPALRNSRGRIVVLSSDSGLCGAPSLSAYTASKHALEGWAESLAYEIRPLGVGLSIVEPGAFNSDIWKAQVSYDPTGQYATLGGLVERAWRNTGESAPSPEPVGEAVLRALDAERPKLRYLVGRDAKQNAILKRFLPEALFRAYTKQAAGIRSW